jgi:Rad3-related DNA helicase
MDRKYVDFFPYEEFKPLQIRVMDFVSEVIDGNAIGLVEAYCGFGKTIATFAPALAKGKKVLLLTPNYTARNAATAETLRINKARGKKIRIADLRAKQLMCRKFPKNLFSHEACYNAKKYEKDCEYYYNTFPEGGRSPSAKAEKTIREIQRDTAGNPAKFFADGIIEKEPVFFQMVQGICDARQLCAYEVMKKMVEKADVVILDYFWCFTAIYSILKQLINPKEFVLLVDEADMLVNRLYNNFHTQLSLTALQRLLKQAREMIKHNNMEEAEVMFLEEFIRYSIRFVQQTQAEQPIPPQKIIEHYTRCFREHSKKMGLKGTICFETIAGNLAGIVETIKGSEEFEKASARPDAFLSQLCQIKDSRQHITYVDAAKNRILIKPLEINNIVLGNGRTPAETLREFHSAVLFSATIGDPQLFWTEFGLKKQETRVFKTESMPHKKLLVIIDTELDTLYKNREKNAPKYIEKIRTIRRIDDSLLISCCNQDEANRVLEKMPSLERAEKHDNLEPNQGYVVNIRSKHARSTNKARQTRNCIIIGLPLPDYSDFYFQQRKKYLEKKYGPLQAGKITNRQAIDTAVQLMGRITRNLSSPKAIILADSRYGHDYFLGDFYYKSIPSYLKPYLQTVENNRELDKKLRGFWKK